MAMVGRPPSMEETFPGYGQRRREGVSDALANALMMLVAPQAMASRVPKFASMDETVSFVRELLKTPSRGREYIPVMKLGMKQAGEKATRIAKEGVDPEIFKRAMEEGTRSQWYREAYEVLSGRMPPWGKLKGGGK